MRVRIHGALIIACAAGSVAAHSETRRYDWLTAGEKSGELIVDDQDRVVTYEFRFNDWGRGPDVTARYELDANGAPISIEMSGVNYAKGDASETFAVENGVARWTVGADEEEAEIGAPALYLIKSTQTPEHVAIMARALLNDPDRRMPTLPKGELALAAIETATFDGPSGPIDATLYALTAESPYPSYVWLDADEKLFAADYGWFAVAPAGMADIVPQLKERQAAARDARTRELSADFAHDASGLVVIRNPRLFDSLKGEMIPQATVFIQDGVISAVYDRHVDAPEEAMVIDGEGMTVLPALWDMHAHVQTESLFNYVSAGVLNIRDMANDPDYLIALRRDLATGAFAGPDVHAMGFIDKRSPYSAPTGKLADTLEDALEFVEWYAQRGFLGIKIYSSIEPEWVAPIAEAAHAHGMMVLGHIPNGMTAEEAIEAGFDEVTHLNMLFLNFADNANGIDTRSTDRIIVPIRDGGALNVDGPGVARLIERMKELNVAHDPTFTLLMGFFTDTPGETMTQALRFADHLPVSEQAQTVASASFNQRFRAEGQATARNAAALIRELHAHGVRLLPGTDTGYPGFVLLRELELYAEAGLPICDVLQLATIEPARHMKLDQTLGSISPGKKAYVVLVDGDPSNDLADLLKVEMVIKGTALYRPKEIHEAFGVTPFH